MKLFEPFTLGKIKLQNRVVMAPLTRSRAAGNVPNDLMAQYYGQRASAGLIITEGTSPSPNGLGYARIPGLFNQEQLQGWKKVTQAVHNKNGKIFMQIMHTGRVSHVANLPAGAKILAPSAVAVSGQVWTDTQAMQNYPIPNEMSESEIREAAAEYVKSAELAMEAGFDGVELHAANGYLLEQFLNPKSNRRTDAYGKTPEGRMKFVLDVAKAVVAKIGADRTGMRISPYGAANDTGAFEGVDEFYVSLTKKLADLGLVYIHVVDHSAMGAPAVSPELKRKIRQTFKGAFILSGGYDATKAQHDLIEDKGDLVAFGRGFISNPDLVEKMRVRTPLKPADSSTFYSPGPKGYTDY